MERFSYTPSGRGNVHTTFHIYDNRLGHEVAWCESVDMAQRIVDALNAAETRAG
jgi:hypothetical protein